MIDNIIKSIKFKRGTKESLERLLIDDKKPLAGEPIFETDTYKLKIGDGYTDYKDLPYIDYSGDIVLEGYYDKENDVFWKEELHINPYPRYIDKIYRDLKSSLYYYLRNNIYTLMIEVASSTTYGVSKLYETTGQNIDGGISQKGLTDALNDLTSVEDELLKIKSDF